MKNMSSSRVSRPLIVLDADGVIFDYRQAFPVVWRAAFGEALPMVQPNAYHAALAYNITWESEAQKQQFEKHFGHEAWATMPLMPGADEALRLLDDSGFELVIVSSMNPEFTHSRIENCRRYALPISAVHAVKRDKEGANPKLELLNQLSPVAFADDLLSNFEGLNEAVHRAYINYETVDSPNIDSPVHYHTSHPNLLAFACYWVAHKPVTVS